MTPIPRQPAPALEVATVDGSRWSLATSRPTSFTMIAVYRSLHCPLCKAYLVELEELLPALARRGVEVIAVSVDTLERAAQAKAAWNLARLRIGYGLTIDTARSWGLFISRAQKASEPSEFAEPGLFLVKPNGTLFTASISSTPWLRPPLSDVLPAIDFFLEHGTLARGES